MAIFDSNKKMYLTFNIVLTDPDEVAAKKALYPETAPLNRAPYNPGPPPSGAAVEFNAPWRGYTQPAASAAPFSWTPWSGEGEQDGPYPLNVATFTRHTGGFLGMGGTTVRYYWIGEFVLAADDATLPGGVAVTGIIPTRHWVEGFEFPNLGPGTFANTGGNYPSPDASRHPGGLGMALRGATAQYTAPTIAQGHATVTAQWQRLYVRLRQLPAASTYFWNNSNSAAASQGTILAITATGEIVVSTRDAGGTFTLAGGTGKVLEVWDGDPNTDNWHKLDILMRVTGTPIFKLYVDGVLVSTLGAQNFGAGNIISSKLGPADFVANDLYLDVDDWIASDIPSKIGFPLVDDLGSLDFTNGSKVVAVHPSSYSATHSVNWTGSVQVVRQNPMGASVSTPASISSSTSGAIADVNTDSALVCDADAGAIGIAALAVVSLSQKTAAAVNADLGYTLNGAAAVTTAVVQGTTPTANAVLYGGPAAAAFTDITPITLRMVKGADANASLIFALGGMAELIGKWTKCDYAVDELSPAEEAGTEAVGYGNTGAHNQPYPRSPWSILGAAAPIAPYIVKGGTYVGNGLGQDLTFRAPVHTLFIRPTTGNLGGYWWMSSSLGAHRVWQEGITAQVSAEEDPTFNGAPGDDSQTLQYRLRLAGNSTQINAVGVTYQYIAIMDPGMRFSLGLALNHKATLGPRTWPLVNPDFTPGFAFLQGENGSATATNRLYGKDLGQAAATMANFAGGTLASALTFGDGEIITDANLHAIVGGFCHAIMLWRKQDGNNDLGEPGVVNFGTYIGDGAASRTINLAPTSGRRPLFCMVFAETGTGRHRDPSHTGTNSSNNTGTEAATGITSGGIDQFSVAAGLNTLGVNFVYFVLYADATACNNGWGCNGEYAPVDPNSPADGPWPPDGTFPEPGTTPTVPPDEEGPTPDPDDPSDDFDVDCVVASTAVLNRALNRIGISKRVANIGTDVGVEAAVARVNWGLDTNQVLRDHPWSFATRYSDLVLVAGTATVPVNKDWQYSYRAPADMLFARRIVGQGGEKRDWDPDPIKFRLGSDGTGILIYTDAAITTSGSETIPVQLEYTIRINCPAGRGDALFRDALVWRHAMSIAGPLTRDPKKVQFCEAMYEQTLVKARAADVQEQQQAKSGDADWIVGRD